MKKIFNILFVVAALAVGVWCETKPVKQCEGENFDNLTSRISVLPCGKTKCKLTKGTNTTTIFKFIPKEKSTMVTNDVSAEVLSFQLPFIGVDGADACGQIKRADTGERAPCPLEPGIEYIYENHFPILELYPDISLTVTWSLLDQNKNKIICFKVPALIVPKSKKKSSSS